jgi:3-isopropylmalate dehydrogenase
MLLETGLNLTGESDALKKAVEKSLEAGIVTEDLDRSNPCSTSMLGDWISDYILHH